MRDRTYESTEIPVLGRTEQDKHEVVFGAALPLPRTVRSHSRTIMLTQSEHRGTGIGSAAGVIIGRDNVLSGLAVTVRLGEPPANCVRE